MTRRKKAEEVLLTPQQFHERYGVALQTLANWRTLDLSPEGPSDGPPWVKTSGKLNRPGGEVRYPEGAARRWHEKRQEPQVPRVHRQALRPTA